MSIKKTLLLAGMALATIAFAAPALAQAEVTLTENGVALTPGAKVTTTSFGEQLQTTTSSGTMTCAKVTLHYEVVTNGPEHVVLDPAPTSGETDNGKAEGCVLHTPEEKGTHVVHISNAGTGQVTIDTWGTAKVHATFTADITTPIFQPHCTFTGEEVHLQATGGGSDILHITPSVLSGAGFLCPSEGTIEGEATVETPNGEGLELDFVETE